MKNGVDMMPTNLPTVSPNKPGIFRQNSRREINTHATKRRIEPPTKSCFPRFSVASCPTISTKVAMHAGNSNPECADFCCPRAVFPLTIRA